MGIKGCGVAPSGELDLDLLRGRFEQDMKLNGCVFLSPVPYAYELGGYYKWHSRHLPVLGSIFSNHC